MHAYKDPLTINVTLSPKELRDLADRCEAAAATAKLGGTCFVDFLAYSKDLQVKLFFDQERTKGSPSFRHE